MISVDTDKTYTLADLGEGSFSGTPLAVIGHPIQHSISPVMHNAALEQLRLKDSRFADWTYYRFDIAPEDLTEALPLFHRSNFLGLNLTIPHKVDALKLVKGISPDARRMGAVNTLIWDEFGYNGFNTDGYGLREGLYEDLDFSLKNAAVVLLGSGGAARAAAVQCVIEGCSELWVGNRSQERLSGLMEVLSHMKNTTRCQSFALASIPKDLPKKGVLINATSLGLNHNDPAPIDLSNLAPGLSIYDMIYNPSPTRLLSAAYDSGRKAADGLSMLVHQGARALEIWSHETVDAHTMMAAACRALQLPPRYA